MIPKFLLFLLLMCVVSTLSAQSVNVDAQGVALEGHDPVAFFTDQKPVKGVPSIKTTAEEATYYFANAANLEAFKAEPKKYLPAYGGFCAYGVAKGSKVKVQIDTWQVTDGKLYLNYDQGVKTKFNKDVPGFVVKANGNWPKVSTSNPLFSF